MEKLIMLGVPLCKLFAVLYYMYMLICKLSDMSSKLELGSVYMVEGKTTVFCFNNGMIHILFSNRNFRMHILS